MTVRPPYQAGAFYERIPATCRFQAEQLFDSAELGKDLPGRLYGGLVPHAGWMYSGRLAALTLKAIYTSISPNTFVLLGADHIGRAELGEVFEGKAWQTPLGQVQINEDLAAAIIKADRLLRGNSQAHSHEHSIEVQIPLLQVLDPQIRIVPITVPPSGSAGQIGEAIASVLKDWPEPVSIVGSTDLTHHGGHFPSPGGSGKAGVQWAVKNDQRMISLIEQMQADRIVPEALKHGNACGAGAIAATISACRKLGATRGICLEYTNSYEVVHAMVPDEQNDTTVGYASVVFA